MNVVLFDSSYEEAEDFIKGLNASTKQQWKAIVFNSNKGRSKIGNVIRYIKYFVFPFYIFLQRKKYERIIGWQEFYGLIYAFYSRLFHVKKVNTLVIKNFIYKPKKGIVGKIYFSFMNFIVKSRYVDVFICASKTNADYCATVFSEDRSKFVFLPFGVNDFTKVTNMSDPPTNDYILSLGRSNRDWDFLINGLANTDYNVKIICDTLYVDNLPSNIEVYNNVHGKESYKFIYNCKCMIIPIQDGQIASGDTVLCQAMSFSKPIIITEPSCLADDYVVDGFNGLIIRKEANELVKAVNRIYTDNELYDRLAKNSRKQYVDKHSLVTYGENVGFMMMSRNLL